MNAQTISITIRQPAAKVYDFLSIPENFKRWAAGLGRMEKHGEEWAAETPAGRTNIRFTAHNDFGIVDHFVKPEKAEEIYVPMRVVANRKFAEVIFTLFPQPSMSGADFARDLNLVHTDLNSLKKLLESGIEKT